MLVLLFAFWAISAVVNIGTSALAVPKYAQLHARGASMPTVENYTATYLLNDAIMIPSQCSASFLGEAIYPATKQLNVSMCRDSCQAFNKLAASRTVPATCRFFNAYILLKNGVNTGQVCDLYDRRWDNSYATNNGTYDSLGRIRAGVNVNAGDVFQVTDSFAYFLTSDPGTQTCSRDTPLLVSQTPSLPASAASAGVFASATCISAGASVSFSMKTSSLTAILNPTKPIANPTNIRSVASNTSSIRKISLNPSTINSLTKSALPTVVVGVSGSIWQRDE